MPAGEHRRDTQKPITPVAQASPRRGHHHRDLRRKLLRVAMVNQAAPYRHFGNLNDLPEALATEGVEAGHTMTSRPSPWPR